MTVHFKTVYRPKFRSFRHDVGDPLCFPIFLPDCLCHVSTRRYSPLSPKVLAKPTNLTFFDPHFLGRGDPDFFTADYRVAYRLPFDNVW